LGLLLDSLAGSFGGSCGGSFGSFGGCFGSFGGVFGCFGAFFLFACNALGPFGSGLGSGGGSSGGSGVFGPPPPFLGRSS
jgi:ATP-dependent RNA helicase A